jgi:hypothetical protein
MWAGREIPGIAMERAKPRETSAVEQPSNGAPKEERYQPPAVAWEEHFEPVAASPQCPNPLDPRCP